MAYQQYLQYVYFSVFVPLTLSENYKGGNIHLVIFWQIFWQILIGKTSLNSQSTT